MGSRIEGVDGRFVVVLVQQRVELVKQFQIHLTYQRAPGSANHK